MLGTCLDRVRETTPLVHNITNYVTVNDVANVLLACGGSPIMSDDIQDVEDITSICGGLNINIGTLKGHPVVLDPVGAGASALRTQTALKLLEEVKFTVVRGNISEIKTLAAGSGTTKGVDADVADAVTEDNLDRKEFSYPGPKPRTKVAAILMITDTVEAASRALAEKMNSPNDFRQLVHSMIKQKADLGQFTECPITYKDLNDIEDTLVKAIPSMYHARIQYNNAGDKANS